MAIITVENPQVEYLRTEAFLALAEFPGTELAPSCAEILAEYATRESFTGDEIRQAAIWGLGKDGLRDYTRLLEFLDVPSDEERVHAVCAFGPELNAEIADGLAAILTNPDSSDRKIAGASYILAKTAPAQLSIPRVIQARSHPSQRAQHWDK